MSGFLTNGVGEIVLPPVSGSGIPIDTGAAAGAVPESAKISLLRLGTALLFLTNNLDLATVNGTRYYRKFSVDFASLVTGVAFLVGSTGGTDSIIVELHDSTGAIVATSDLAGTVLGTANTWQQIAFTAGYSAIPGDYWIAIQSNGNTGKLRAYQSPGLALLVGSAGGVFGTSAAITPPTTYTANVGPVSQLY